MVSALTDQVQAGCTFIFNSFGLPMRKILVCILALLHLALASGATMHLHYCMGQLVDTGLQHKAGNKCGKCGMKKTAAKDNGCCKDEHKFVQLAEAQKTASLQMVHVMELSAVAILPSPLEFHLLPATLNERFPISHAPPLQGSLPIYLRNCVFRI